MKILVLIGGETAEREVSLDSGAAVAGALASNGHQVETLDIGNEKQCSGFIAEIERYRSYDCIFIALHGGIGENGTLQALLDISGVKYTGSGVRASALAMDKYRSKLIFQASGIPIPITRCFGTSADVMVFVQSDAARKVHYPLVVKPNAQGSTVGISIVENYGVLAPAVTVASQHDTDIMIEDYIPGRDLTVAFLGDVPLPVVEIKARSGFYDYKAKYTTGEADYIYPAELDKKTQEKITRYATTAYLQLGCRGFARVDFRLNPSGDLYCLEVNTIPGMTSSSLVPKAAQAAGISFEELLEKIIGYALTES